MRKDFNYLYSMNMDEWLKIKQIYFQCFQNEYFFLLSRCTFYQNHRLTSFGFSSSLIISSTKTIISFFTSADALARWNIMIDTINVLNRLKDLNSLAPRKFERNFTYVIFKRILVIDDWGISCEIALTWKPQDLTDDKSILVQVMAWCRQATSHYPSQCWPSSLSPYGVTRPQWVKRYIHILNCILDLAWSK